MCLAVPGRVVAVAEGDVPAGTVELGGVPREVSLVCVPDVAVGDYVLVHLGMAIDRLDEETARSVLADLQRLAT